MTRLVAALRRVPRILTLAVWTLWAVITASAMVARDIVAPSARLAPAVIIVPNRCANRWELSTFVGLITITPGTLVVGIEPDRNEVWVHGMYGADPDGLRTELEDLQARVIHTLRLPTTAGGGR